ncbi:MAG: TonB-dependent receptor [Acidobacteriota bacterium]
MKHPFSKGWIALVVVVLGLGFPTFVAAQTVTATLTGTVTDQSGALVPNVAVVATNQGTKIEYRAPSNDAGVYTIPFLPIGTYVVTVEASGFKKLVTNPIKLEVNQTARVDLKLELGEITQQIDVMGVAPVLQTETVTVGQVISGNTTVSLPLNGRNFQQLTLLVPGAISPNTRGFTGAEASARPFVNGNREQGNAFLLDGISVDETIDNRIGYRPNVDAIAEFKMETNNSSAEFGNVTGAITNMSMKSGTNEFHGNLFEFLRNDAMDANTWANNRSGARKQKLRLNIFGGTIGGPIIKDKLFFFGAYQETRQRTGGGTTASVAPVEWRNGDLSSISTVIRDPLTGQPFTNNQIPVERFSPTARALFSDPRLYPLPTRAGTNVQGNYVTSTADAVNNHQFDIKLDTKLSDSDSLWGRYSFGDLDGKGIRGTLPTNITSLRTQRPQNFVLTWNRTISPTTVNEARIGFNRAVFISDFNDWSGIGQANSRFGVPGSQAINGLSELRIGQGLSNVGSTGINEDNVTNTFHYGNNLSMARGKHFLKMGGQWQRYQQNRYYPGNNGLLGFFSYTGQFTGSAFADFLLDQLSQKGRGSLSGTWGHRQNRVGIFFQDDWKFRNNLTLNLGMRWEYTSPVVEVKDRQSNFDILTGRQLFAGQDGNSRALYEPFYKGFEPRVGFAWTPGILNNRLVVRAGYGITQYMEGTGSNLRLPLNPPFFSEADVTFDNTSGPGTISTGFTDVIVRDQPAGLIRVWDPELRPQFTQQWNFTLEFQLDSQTSVNAGYVAHKATHLVDPRDWNQALPDPGPVSTWRPLQQRRPLYQFRPLVTAISGTDSSATSDYHSLQVNARRRLTQGLEFLASYTLSKTLTDNLGYYGSAGVAGPSAYWANAYNRRADRGLSFFDALHNFVWSGTYELPFGKGKTWGSDWNGIANAVLGGWNVSSIVSMHSGFPITIRANDVSQQAPRGGGRPNRLAGRTGAVSNPTLERWLDIAAFELPAPGTFGNSGNSTNRAPGFANWDFSVGKKFTVSEQKYFDFRAEFFNFTNHPSYSPPANNISAPNTFGTITSTVSDPRILEFALKFHF